MSDEQITPDEGAAAPAPGGTVGAGGPSRRGLLKAGIVAGAVAGTGAWREAPAKLDAHGITWRPGRCWIPTRARLPATPPGQAPSRRRAQ